jgi:hypothetical protein
MSVVRRRTVGSSSVLTAVEPGQPGYVEEDYPFGMIEQGATWDEIIVTAYQDCWFILKNKEVFGTACEQLAAKESIVLTSERPKGHKTDCWFTADNPTVLAMGTMDAVARPAGGPIHTIPPLNG